MFLHLVENSYRISISSTLKRELLNQSNSKDKRWKIWNLDNWTMRQDLKEHYKNMKKTKKNGISLRMI
jgi:hypothetical protein